MPESSVEQVEWHISRSHCGVPPKVGYKTTGRPHKPLYPAKANNGRLKAALHAQSKIATDVNSQRCKKRCHKSRFFPSFLIFNRFPGWDSGSSIWEAHGVMMLCGGRGIVNGIVDWRLMARVGSFPSPEQWRKCACAGNLYGRQECSPLLMPLAPSASTQGRLPDGIIVLRPGGSIEISRDAGRYDRNPRLGST